MVNVVLFCKNLESKEEIYHLFEFKDDRFYFANIPLKNLSIEYDKNSFKAFFRLGNTTDIQKLNNICLNHDNIEVIIVENMQQS